MSRTEIGVHGVEVTFGVVQMQTNQGPISLTVDEDGEILIYMPAADREHLEKIRVLDGYGDTFRLNL